MKTSYLVCLIVVNIISALLGISIAYKEKSKVKWLITLLLTFMIGILVGVLYGFGK